MKINKKLIEKYNEPGSVLVITNYPPPGEGFHAAKIGGVSGFAKNTLIPLAQKLSRDNRRIIVLADILTKPTVYEENDMLIVRAWHRDNPILYGELIASIINFWRVRDIFIEFEFASYGDFVTTSLFPFFLALLRLTGKRITTALHQVVTDLLSITGHIGLDFDSQEFKLFSVLLPLYYFFITRLSTQTIVLEDEFRRRLGKLAPKDSVLVIPHGIEERVRIPSKKKSRKTLGIDPNEYVVTSFGFVTWYKGTDLLIDLLKDPATVNGRPVRLVIAGGESTSQKHKTHYRKFYSDVVESVRGKKHITMTGFVPEDKISLYLSASDVVVFPYRTVMSSSGPLSLAIAHKKPILLSPAMRAILSSTDIKSALKELNLHEDSLIMPYNTRALTKHMERMGKPFYQSKIKRFEKTLISKRSFTHLSGTYYTVFTPNEEVVKSYVTRPAFR